ncbi:MAG: hypothetical protein ACRDOG_12420 [Gaiellaceae bacterium]
MHQLGVAQGRELVVATDDHERRHCDAPEHVDVVGALRAATQRGGCSLRGGGAHHPQDVLGHGGQRPDVVGRDHPRQDLVGVGHHALTEQSVGRLVAH